MKFQFVINKKRRSLISCTRCRSKKLKCDEIKPSCTRCLTTGSYCEYTKASESKNERRVTKQYTENTSNFSILGGSQQQQLLENEISNYTTDTDNIEFTGLAIPTNVDIDKALYDIDKFYTDKINDIEEINNNNELNEEVHNLIQNYRFSSFDDIEFQALTIISTSGNMKDMFNRYNKCYSLILPLAYTNKTVMYSFAGWILSLNNQNINSQKFLNESIKLINSNENLLNKSIENLEGLFVSQTCHAILASSRGDYTTWRNMFDRNYQTIKSIGIDKSIELMHKSPSTCWVLAWFFYQDIFKMGKTSSQKFSSPLFPKHIYKKIIEISVKSKLYVNDKSLIPCCGPLTRCCTELCIITGEVKSLYDLFSVKLKELNNFNKINILPILNNQLLTKEEKNDFLNTEIFEKYSNMKKHFFNWFGMKAGILESKIIKVMPDLNNEDFKPDQIEKICKFHELLKLSIRIFLKVKILKCSIISFEIKILCKQILDGIKNLVSWELNNCLLFPFITAGSCIYEMEDKLIFEMLYKDLQKHIKSENLNRAWEMIQKIWNSQSELGFQNELGDDIVSIIDCDVCVF